MIRYALLLLVLSAGTAQAGDWRDHLYMGAAARAAVAAVEAPVPPLAVAPIARSANPATGLARIAPSAGTALPLRQDDDAGLGDLLFGDGLALAPRVNLMTEYGADDEKAGGMMLRLRFKMH